MGADNPVALFSGTLPASPHDFRSNLDLHDLIRMLSQRRWFIVLLTSALLLLAGLYHLLATPTYRADALLKVQSNQGFVQSMLETDRTSVRAPYLTVSPAHDESQILTSRAVLGAVVDAEKLTLSVQPHYLPVMGRGMVRNLDPETLEALKKWWPAFSGGFAWTASVPAIGRFEVSASLENRKFLLTAGAEPGSFSLYLGSKALIANGKVKQVYDLKLETGQTVSLLMNDIAVPPGTPFALERVSRAAAMRTLEKSLKVKSNDKDSQVIELTLDGDDPQRLATVLNAIMTTYQRLSQDWDTREAKLKLKFVEGQLPEIKKQLEAAEEQLNAHRSRQRSFNFSAEARALLGQTVEDGSRLAQLKQKRAVLSRKFTPLHSDFAPLDAEIAAVEGQIRKLNQRAAELPGAQQTMLRLTREVEVNKDLYVKLLNSVHEQRVATAGSVPPVRFIDEAIEPDKPVWPKAFILYPGAMLAGLLLSVTTLIAGRAMKADLVGEPTLQDRALGGQVYATLPHSKTERQLNRRTTVVGVNTRHPPLLANLYPEEPAVESLRSLRTILLRKLSTSANNLVIITSPGSGMGKSFVSANLAVLFATLGKRVLIIDADLRRGKLHQLLGIGFTAGLADVAAGTLTMQESVVETVIPNLYAVTRGSISAGSPAELLAKSETHAALTAISREYDVCIMDTPPVLDVADTAIVGRVAGSVLMVVKSGAVRMPQISESFKRLAMSGVTLDGYILNSVDPGSNANVYGYSVYGEFLPWPNQRPDRQLPKQVEGDRG